MKTTIKIHIQNHDRTYDVFEVSKDNKALIDKIKAHNKKVRSTIYFENKNFSKFSVEDIQRIIGHELVDLDSSPLEKRIVMEKERIFNEALEDLGQALKTLTVLQNEIIMEYLIEEKTLTEIARQRNKNYKTIYESYLSAFKKLKSYYRQKQKLKEFFPNLFKD